MLDKINLRSGKVTYNEFGIDLSKTPQDQEDYLDLDLVQIKYGMRYTVDVGWYPMHDPKGFFLIRVIEDYDWSEPLLKLKVKKFKDFIKSLQKTIDFINTYKKENLNKPYRQTWYDFMETSDEIKEDEKIEMTQSYQDQASMPLIPSDCGDDERYKTDNYIAPIELPADLIKKLIGHRNKKNKK